MFLNLRHVLVSSAFRHSRHFHVSILGFLFLSPLPFLQEALDVYLLFWSWIFLVYALNLYLFQILDHVLHDLFSFKSSILFWKFSPIVWNSKHFHIFDFPFFRSSTFSFETPRHVLTIDIFFQHFDIRLESSALPLPNISTRCLLILDMSLSTSSTMSCLSPRECLY